MQGYGSMKPGELRQLIRDKRITCHTSGMAAGYAQANLVILPNEYADDFMEYTRLNPAPCPVLEVLRHTPYTRIMAAQIYLRIFPNTGYTDTASFAMCAAT